MKKLIYTLIILLSISCNNEEKNIKPSVSEKDLIIIDSVDIIIDKEITSVETPLSKIQSFIDTIKLLSFHPNLTKGYNTAINFANELNFNYHDSYSEEESLTHLIIIYSTANPSRKIEFSFEFSGDDGSFYNQRHILSTIPENERSVVIDSLTNWIQTLVNVPSQKFEKFDSRNSPYSRGLYWNQNDSIQKVQYELVTWGSGNYNWIEINRSYSTYLVYEDEIIE